MNDQCSTTTKLSVDVKKLKATVVQRLVIFFAASCCMFFIPAGTIRYWEAWAYLAILFLPALIMMLYLFKHDPALLERRMKMKEKQTEQKNIMKWSYAFFVLAFIIPGLDKRFEWSSVPVVVVILADSIIFTGYLLLVRVLRENSYASRIIEVSEKQKIISTGPYAVIRHPMYLAALMMWVFSPVALGSYWAVIPASSIIVSLVARILNEEKFLVKELDGYAEYTKKTRNRLIPGVW